MADQSVTNPFFEQLGSILHSKTYWILDDEREKQYNPIGVNIGLSQHIDAILHVNEMNKYWRVLSPKMNYDYYFYSIRKMNRKFNKWAKKTKDDDIQMVMEYYQMNRSKAQKALLLLSKEQLKEIKADMDKGTV